MDRALSLLAVVVLLLTVVMGTSVSAVLCIPGDLVLLDPVPVAAPRVTVCSVLPPSLAIDRVVLLLPPILPVRRHSDSALEHITFLQRIVLLQ